MKATIRWVDPNYGESEHRIYRDTAPLDPQNLPAPVGTAGPNTTSWVDENVTDQTTYYYRVAAVYQGQEYLSAEFTKVVNGVDVPANGLVAWYTMDNVSGSTLVDETGTHNGTISGATLIPDGIDGQAIRFSATGDIVSVPDSTDFEFPGAFAISFWLRSTVESNRVIVEKDGNSGWSVQTSGTLPGSILVNINGITETSGYDYRGAGWMHFLVRYTATGSGSVEVYVNGIETSYPRRISGSPNYGSGNVNLGHRPNSSITLDGDLDQVRFYNRLLTLDEISLLAGEFG